MNIIIQIIAFPNVEKELALNYIDILEEDTTASIYNPTGCLLTLLNQQRMVERFDIIKQFKCHRNQRCRSILYMSLDSISQ